VIRPRQTAVVIAPGRGTYNAGELGYLGRWHADRQAFVAMADAYRAAQGQPTLSQLDGAPSYSAAVQARGDNASPLIFACSYLDFLAIDREAFEIVAVTGNSMGWYTALACAGAVDEADGLALVDTMGSLMQAASIGGQAIWSLVDEAWRPIPGRRAALLATMAAIVAEGAGELHVSIELGGMLVIGGDAPGLAAMTERAPRGPGRFPLALAGHAGFHSPLQAPVSAKARATIAPEMFGQPRTPLIDGAGRIWAPKASDVGALWDYTLGEQVVRTYDFTRAVGVAVREFAPERIIVLGPGETLGGAVAQALIAADWKGLGCKADFQALQAGDPPMLAMGRADQRALVVTPTGPPPSASPPPPP
jgi:acyl transferase domain-containing protein